MCVDLIKESFNPQASLVAKCERCSHDKDVEIKQTNILLYAPNVLAVQLLRFKNDAGVWTKNSQPVLCEKKIYFQSPGENATIYQHKATVSHSGLNATSGHYVAYKKFQNQYFRLSDTHGSQITRGTFNNAALLGVNTATQETPYVLIYDKISN